jgi:hypothetical protein
MILLIAIPSWILAVSLLLGLCVAARRSDSEHAAALAAGPWASAEPAPHQARRAELARPRPAPRRARVAEGKERAHSHSGSAAA